MLPDYRHDHPIDSAPAGFESNPEVRKAQLEIQGSGGARFLIFTFSAIAISPPNTSLTHVRSWKSCLMAVTNADAF
jgi:hypothetical protein